MGDLDVDAVLRRLDLLEHPTCPPRLRRLLPRLRRIAMDSPPRAIEVLRERARPVLHALPRQPPSGTLYRVQSLEVFHFHCTRERFRVLDALTFRRLVNKAGDPGKFLLSTIDVHRTLFPWDHSWMVATDSSILDATAARVTVRPPNAADAALGGHVSWRPGDVPAGSEYVDWDVPGAAVEEVRWKPER